MKQQDFEKLLTEYRQAVISWDLVATTDPEAKARLDLAHSAIITAFASRAPAPNPDGVALVDAALTSATAYGSITSRSSSEIQIAPILKRLMDGRAALLAALPPSLPAPADPGKVIAGLVHCIEGYLYHPRDISNGDIWLDALKEEIVAAKKHFGHVSTLDSYNRMVHGEAAPSEIPSNPRLAT